MALALAGGTFACGDDEPARDQTVFWLSLSTAPGSEACSAFDTFDVPNDGTARNITTGSGAGARFVDGSGAGGFVQCIVRESSMAGQFDVSLNVSGGDFGNLNVSGLLAGEEATLEVSFATTAAVRLEQDDCTASVAEVRPGAVWLQNLSCPTLVDESSPNISCTGTGGFIAENCSR